MNRIEWELGGPVEGQQSEGHENTGGGREDDGGVEPDLVGC